MLKAPMIFNPPPGWPKPPAGWAPPKGWTPDPSWPEPPPGWQLWIAADPIDQASQPSPNAAAPRPAKAPAGRVQPPTASDHARQLAILQAENDAMRARLQSQAIDPEAVIVLDDERVLQAAGIYRYHHPLENSLANRVRLDELQGRFALMIKSGQAIERSNTFTLDGSLAKGQSLASDLARLMLRAYNAEAENVIRTLRLGNVETAARRLEQIRSAIATHGKSMGMRIADGFHRLRLEEVELTADYLMKKEEEREAARAERERLREERKVELELAAERERLEKERSHIQAVIDRIRSQGEIDPMLQNKLTEIDAAIARNDYRAANIRAGYVYVISNRGAFGGHVVKIGLTRRLEPLERIFELGDASVPFRFDVHALFFSEDAVGLERELHEHFAHRRVNWVNDRKEFFFVAPAEVRTVLEAKVGNLLEFVEKAESTEYLQSASCWPIRENEVGPIGATEIPAENRVGGTR